MSEQTGSDLASHATAIACMQINTGLVGQHLKRVPASLWTRVCPLPPFHFDFEGFKPFDTEISGCVYCAVANTPEFWSDPEALSKFDEYRIWYYPAVLLKSEIQHLDTVLFIEAVSNQLSAAYAGLVDLVIRNETTKDV